MTQLETRNDRNTSGLNDSPFEELKPGTPLAGVKLGGRGKDLRVGQRLRAVASYSGQDLRFEVRIKGRIPAEATEEPELLLEDLRGRLMQVPESAIAQRGHGILQFRRAEQSSREKRQKEIRKARENMLIDHSSMIPPEERVNVGEYVRGVRPDGVSAIFYVSGINEAGRPLLETLTTGKNPPKRFEVRTAVTGEQRAGKYRIDGVPSVEEVINSIARNLTPRVRVPG